MRDGRSVGRGRKINENMPPFTPRPFLQGSSVWRSIRLYESVGRRKRSDVEVNKGSPRSDKWTRSFYRGEEALREIMRVSGQ